MASKHYRFKHCGIVALAWLCLVPVGCGPKESGTVPEEGSSAGVAAPGSEEGGTADVSTPGSELATTPSGESEPTTASPASPEAPPTPPVAPTPISFPDPEPRIPPARDAIGALGGFFGGPAGFSDIMSIDDRTASFVSPSVAHGPGIPDRDGVILQAVPLGTSGGATLSANTEGDTPLGIIIAARDVPLPESDERIRAGSYVVTWAPGPGESSVTLQTRPGLVAHRFPATDVPLSGPQEQPHVRIASTQVCFYLRDRRVCAPIGANAALTADERGIITQEMATAAEALALSGESGITAEDLDFANTMPVVLGRAAVDARTAPLLVTPLKRYDDAVTERGTGGRWPGLALALRRPLHETTPTLALASLSQPVDVNGDGTDDLGVGNYDVSFTLTNETDGIWAADFTAGNGTVVSFSAHKDPNDNSVTQNEAGQYVEIGSFCILRWCIP